MGEVMLAAVVGVCIFLSCKAWGTICRFEEMLELLDEATAETLELNKRQRKLIDTAEKIYSK